MSALVRLGGGHPPALVMFDLDGTLLDSARIAWITAA